jgi:hypothetical protein
MNVLSYFFWPFVSVTLEKTMHGRVFPKPETQCKIMSILNTKYISIFFYKKNNTNFYALIFSILQNNFPEFRR